MSRTACGHVLVVPVLYGLAVSQQKADEQAIQIEAEILHGDRDAGRFAVLDLDTSVVLAWLAKAAVVSSMSFVAVHHWYEAPRV